MKSSKKLLMSLYENLADSIIDREEYTRLKASFTARADEAVKQRRSQRVLRGYSESRDGKCLDE